MLQAGTPNIVEDHGESKVRMKKRNVVPLFLRLNPGGGLAEEEGVSTAFDPL